MTDDFLACCTLPAAEQVLRLAEFDALLGSFLLAQSRPEPTRLSWRLRPAAADRARELAGRESECCAFFSFTFTSAADALTMDIEVPPALTGVLDTLAVRRSQE